MVSISHTKCKIGSETQREKFLKVQTLLAVPVLADTFVLQQVSNVCTVNNDCMNTLMCEPRAVLRSASVKW